MPISAEILYDTDTVQIQWHPADRVLEFTWRSFLSGDELHEAFDQMIVLSAKVGANRWLTDYTDMSAMRLADQDWMVENYTPRITQQLTLHRSAMVRPSHSLGAYFMDSMLARISSSRPWPLLGFNSRYEAYAWLTEADPLPPFSADSVPFFADSDPAN